MASIPFWKPGQTITGHAKTAVIERRFLAIAGPRVEGNPQVGHAAANARVEGVSSVSKAAGDKVMFWHDGVQEVEAAAAITAGAAVASDAQGRAVPWTTGTVAGYAFDDIASGAAGPIRIV